MIGPIVHYLNSLDALNTSNQRTRDFLQGKYKEVIPDTGVVLWIDVRDVALAHVKAIEVPEAAGLRFFATAGKFSNKHICEVIRKNFPEYHSALPSVDVKGGDLPEGPMYGYDNTRTANVLGIQFRSLEDSIVDLVKSLKAVGA